MSDDSQRQAAAARRKRGEEGEESADSSDGGSDVLSSPFKKKTWVGGRQQPTRAHPVPPTPSAAGARTSCAGGRRAPPSRAPPLPPSVKYNLLNKLHFRQMYGKIQSRGSRGAEEMKVFSRLPGRLAFFIRDAVPMSALAAGHVFLGFSKCGQYLLSYTQTTTEGDQFDLVNFNYYYRLHWWLFLPYAKARKVAEVTLFANQVCCCCKHQDFLKSSCTSGSVWEPADSVLPVVRGPQQSGGSWLAQPGGGGGRDHRWSRFSALFPHRHCCAQLWQLPGLYQGKLVRILLSRG